MAVTDPATRIERMLAFAEQRIAEEFAAALAVVRASIDMGALATLLEQGRMAEAFTVVQQAASKLNFVWAESFVRAGTQTGDWLGRNVSEIVIGFDQTNFAAVNTMRNNGLRLVQGFTEQQRVATNQALVDGITRGANPREMARAFRNSIGLTAKQEGWVRNYERQLKELDAGALRRELRDRRFDRTTQRAIDNGTPLTKSQVTKMVGRYRDRWRKLRSETIARTESLRSVHAGTREMYNQAIGNGQLQRDQLTRIWNTAGDARVRDFPKAETSHRTMDQQERQFDEPFMSGAGNLATDPGGFGVAMDDINCRCAVSTRIGNLDAIPGFVGVAVTSNL